MHVAIKVKDQKEYKEAKKLLIEKGFISDKKWNIRMYKEMHLEKEMHYIIVYDSNNFSLHLHSSGTSVILDNISEFLTLL